MTQTNQDPTKINANESSLPFNQALGEVIKNLKGQPFLLFILGAGLLFLMGATQVPAMSAVAAPLLILFILGMVIWGFLEIQKVRQGKIQTGNVKIAQNVSAEHSDVETGAISGGSASGKSNMKTGDVGVQSSAQLKGVKIKTGEVKFNTPSAPKKEDQKK